MKIVRAETSIRNGEYLPAWRYCCPAWWISSPINPTVIMGFAQVTKNIEHIRKEHNELFDIPNFAKYYNLKIIIGFKENTDGLKGPAHLMDLFEYKCQDNPHYCLRKGSWYNSFRLQCLFTCSRGKIYPYPNCWPKLWIVYHIYIDWLKSLFMFHFYMKK